MSTRGLGQCEKMEQNNDRYTAAGIKRTVLDYDDIRQMAPFFDGKPRLVKVLQHMLSVDRVNDVHSRHCETPGVPFTEALLTEWNVTRDIRGEEHLDDPSLNGAYITVSNHPFGAIDGIMLINLLGKRRPDVKVMVNMILNHIEAMRPNFIAVDALASKDPAKQAVSRKGMMEAMRHVRDGHVLSFFPAGAVSKFTWRLRIEDREWQPSVIRLIKKLRVPVVPIYFHGHNSLMFNLLGLIDWRLRTLKLPSEVFRHNNDTMRISIGEPVSVADQDAIEDVSQLATYLRTKTYDLRQWQ